MSNDFGAQLRHLRLAAGLTQEDLAERAGLSLNAISALERGQRQYPYPHTVQVLADALDLGPGERAALRALVPMRVTKDVAPLQPVAGIPTWSTPLLGREVDLIEASTLLLAPSTRLLTLTGPGGVGKTRLAYRLASDHQSAFPDGVSAVSLASTYDPERVLAALVAGLGLQGRGDASPRELLVGFMGDRRLLLVMDNLEQVVGAACDVADLLAACPNLTILATSRVPLHIDGEQEYPVAPLALPERGVAGGRAPTESPAVRLFAERARAVDPSFVLNDETAPEVAELCARLDGLPLAIELAASRTKLLGPKAMVRRMPKRLDLLTGGGPDRPTRLQTMRGAIAWSYELLAPSQRTCFRHLSVFTGGSTLDDAVEVEHALDPGTAFPQVFDDIAALMDHSLVTHVHGADNEDRIGMLETIREFGLERLEAEGELARCRSAHADWFMALVRRSCEDIEGPRRREAHQRVASELENIREALGWLVAEGRQHDARTLANHMARFWIDLGHIAEGRDWFDRVLAMGNAGDASSLGEALTWAAGFANLQDASPRAIDLAARALTIAREAGDRVTQAMALTELAEAVSIDSTSNALNLLREAYDLIRTERDPIREGLVLRRLGIIAFRDGDLDAARAYHEQGLAIWRTLDHPWGVPAVLRELATVAIAQGDPVSAREALRESLDHWRTLGEPLHISDSMGGLARVALSTGNAAHAAYLLSARDALDRSMGYVPPRASREMMLESVRSALDPEEFDAWWTRGQVDSLDVVLDAALGSTARSRSPYPSRPRQRNP